MVVISALYAAIFGLAMTILTITGALGSVWPLPKMFTALD
jgi:hypothetical protein